MEAAEQFITSGVQLLKLVVETTGAVVIAIGFATAVFRFAGALLRGADGEFNSVRLVFARYLALALEFQLGADILSTAIAPSWDQIGKLAVIAVIRTGLNYFLSLEMESQRRAELGPRHSSSAMGPSPGPDTAVRGIPA